MNNNANIGEAYRNQLYNQMSLIQLERYARAEMLNEGNECTDGDDRQDEPWDPMQDVQFSDYEGAAGDAMEDGTEDRDDVDSGLPRKYRSKMKRYEHFKNMIPNNLPPQPARFEYEKENLMSAQAVAYAELLKICQSTMLERVCTMIFGLGQSTGIRLTKTFFTEHSHANKWNCNKITSS